MMRRTVAGIGRLCFAIAALGPVVPSASAQESWDALYIGAPGRAAKVGFIHTKVQPVEDRGRQLLRVQFDEELNIKRQDDKVTMRVRYGTIETPDGRVLRLDTRLQTGLDEVRTYGDVVNNQMVLKLEANGQRSQVVLAWPPDVRGPYAVEQSLSREPMKPGETRTLKEFIPNINVIGVRTLNARSVEDVELGGGEKRALLRIDSSVALPDGKPQPELDTTFWIDPTGQVLKSFTDVFGGFTTYRTTKEAATSTADSGRFDLIAASILRVVHKIPNPGQQRRVVYQIALTGDDPASLFPNDRRQTLRPAEDGRSATLEVATAGPEVGQPGPDAVDPQYLRANPMINSEDTLVIRATNEATRAAGTDPWARAVAINSWVARKLESKNFKTAFASAAEVVRMRSGDCTEHSVLAAAMHRAAGIPARVAVGLVYAENLGGFGFHMWNEVYVNRRWVALDPSFDQSQVDATHIKLSDASLDGVSPYEPFLAVSRVFSKMTLDPVELR